MSIYDEIDPLAYAELYQSIYPDWKGKQELLDLIGNTQEIKPKAKLNQRLSASPLRSLSLILA